MINCIKWQHQKRKSVSKAYSKSESELQIIKRALKNKQIDVFNVYLAKNEICKTRQTSKHLLLNCKHYRAEQLQLKAKAQFKNMNIILMLFIIKIERIAMLKYLKST